eukprot:GEMP01036500.1.p1 GENE.GEMP01036500.1~~GEMP01036500.1.p1  ORF type:complete len:275 (+),score=47.30 GEMP01036500.1:227-1051(+)
MPSADHDSGQGECKKKRRKKKDKAESGGETTPKKRKPKGVKEGDTPQTITTVITDVDKQFVETPFLGLMETKSIWVYKHKMKVCKGDICNYFGDAAVNAANEGGLGGGGVDGAINKAGGPDLHKAREELPELEPDVRIKTGSAVVTIGGDLPCPYVLHAVGPVYGGNMDSYDAKDGQLRSAYRSALNIAAKQGLRNIAFPLICGGVFRGKRALDMVMKTGWDTCVEFLKTNEGPRMTICFVSFSEFEGSLLRSIARQTPKNPPPILMRLMPCMF